MASVREALKIGRIVVALVLVAVMNVVTFRNNAVGCLPDCAV